MKKEEGVEREDETGRGRRSRLRYRKGNFNLT